MRIAFAVCFLAAAGPPFGEARGDALPAQHREAAGGTAISYKHQGQFGIYAQFGAGYRALFRYDKNDFCGDVGSGVCTGFARPWVELGLSYAPTNRIEIITDFRIGLVDDFHPDTSVASAPRQYVLAPGAKVYIDDKGSLKWFGTFQVAFDFTDYSADGVAGSFDVGVRNVNGLLIDLHRTFGLYFHVGESVSFLRWLVIEADAGVGMQARFP